MAWFGYRINRSLATGSKFPFLMLAIGTILLVVLGAQAIFLGLFSIPSLSAEGIENRFGGGFFDSYWWSIKHVLDPGAFAEDYGAPIPVLFVSFAISIGGLAVLGALIGLISASIQQRLARLELGNTRVIESGHVVVLGWGPSTPGLVRNMLRIHTGRSIVILAPRELQLMREGLRRGGIDLRRRDIVLRSGIPSRRSELERVAIQKAASIAVVAHALEEEQEGAETDVEAIKTLLVLEGTLREDPRDDEGDAARGELSATDKPAIVCEISKHENAEIARIASRGRVSSVSTADFASRLLVQAARQPGIADVFEQILNREAGGILVQSEPDAIGVTFEQLAHSVENAVPIGVSWVESSRGEDRNVAALNPEPSDEVDEGEKIVFLARNDAVLVRSPVQSWPAKDGPVLSGGSDSSDRHFASVLILGWNSLMNEILSELNGHAMGRTRVTVISNTPSDQTDRILTDANFSQLDIEMRRGDTVSRSLLAELVDADYDCIFALADESDGGDPDAKSIMTLLLLGDISAQRKRPRVPRVVVELQDGRNRELLEGSIATEVVVSPDLVSVVMAQISLQPVLGPVYRELLSAGGIEIALRPASRYAPLDETTLHADVISAGHQRFETVLGVRLVHSGGAKVILSPDAGQRWIFTEEDRIIVLSQQVYR